MARIALSRRFVKAYARLPRPLRTAADKALRTLIERPHHAGLNLESVVNRPGYFTIRATRSHRILLLKLRDEAGELWSVEDIDTHEIYR
jgi:hypothetical protein